MHTTSGQSARVGGRARRLVGLGAVGIVAARLRRPVDG
jgi:hypothetical protein